MSLIHRPEAMPHQVKTVEFGKRNPYFICAIDPGGGKSFCLLALHDLFKYRTLVILPSYLLLKWHMEIQKWFGATKKVTLIKKKEDIYALWDTDICIVGYSNLAGSEVLFEWAEQVSFDEAQFLKEMGSQRTNHAHQFVYEYGNYIKSMVLLTGTPILNRVAEYYSLIALCNYHPKYTEKNPSPFLEKFPDQIAFADYFSNRKSYTIEVNGKFVKVVRWTGIKNTDELKKWLTGIYIRFGDEHWMKDKPQVIDVPVSSKSIPELQDAYETFCENESGVSPAIKVEAALKTVPYTIKYIEGLLSEGIKKIIVFSDHVEPAEMVAQHFNTVALTSKISNSRQFKLVQAFQTDPEVSVISGTIGTMSTGHDIYASRDVVFNDESWVPGQNKQAWKRSHRKGQEGRVRIHKMYGSPQHAAISKSLAEKLSVIEKAVEI